MAETGDWRTWVDMKCAGADTEGQGTCLAVSDAGSEVVRLEKSGKCRASDGGPN
jgi:hypothetical protein